MSQVIAKSSNPRSSEIELLRIIAMLAIVMHHDVVNSKTMGLLI